MKKKLFMPALAAGLLLALQGACAHKEAPTEEEIRAQGKALESMAQPKDFHVIKSPYIGAKSLPLSEENAPILSTHVTMKSKGTIRDVAAVLARLMPSVTVNLVEDDGQKRAPAGPVRKPGQAQAKELKPGETAEPTIEELLAEEPAPARLPEGRMLNISYSGPLSGLLNQIGAQSGYGWDYDRATNTVTIAAMIMRTFHVSVMPGSATYSLNLTNKSKQEKAGSLSSVRNVNSPSTQETVDAQTTQTSTVKATIDAWKEIMENVKMLCSPRGKASGSMSSGTVTVHDHPDNIRKIRRYLDKVNAVYMKQVALKINVYSLVLSDNNEVGFDIAAVFTNNPAVSIAAGTLSMLPGTTGTASAAILKGDLAGSSGVLKALKKWGTATEITSGGLVARNNVPTPMQALRKYTYVAGSSTATTQYGQDITVTPGEVTTGFSMTVLPHILEGRRVMLNCDVSLAYLESLDTFQTGTTRVQLPQTSSRAFSQSAILQQGQTLVLAGYQQAAQDIKNSAGIISASRDTDFGKTLLIVTIQVENAAPEIAGKSGDVLEAS